MVGPAGKIVRDGVGGLSGGGEAGRAGKWFVVRGFGGENKVWSLVNEEVRGVES